MPEHVLIDTDPGIDDAMALLLALLSPELEIAAITTVSGNVFVDTATRNVFTILSLLSPEVRPSVAKGASRPRRKEPIHAAHIHGDDGLGRLDRYHYPSPSGTLSDRHAVDEILYQLRVSAQPLTVIALGPLTNIAEAIEKDREVMAKVKRIVMMGGAVAVPGNITPVAEFNLFVDPHAASIVFNAGIPLTVVPLDVTRQVKLTEERLTAAVACRQTAVSQFLLDCTAEAFAFAKEQEGEACIYLHDPLAVSIVIDPSLVSMQAMHIEIETQGEITQGMTVADRRSLKPALKKPPNAEICVGVDAQRFVSFLLERIVCSRLS